MTIQIPDDLARGLSGMAAARGQSVEQLALERLSSLLEAAQTPQAILRRLRELPHPSVESVNELEAAIERGELPLAEDSVFDSWRTE